MKWDAFGQILVAVLTVGAAYLQIQRQRTTPRQSVMHDLDILDRLPKESKARGQLAEYIDRAILKSIEHETELRRDPSGLVIAAIILVGSVAAFYYGWSASLMVKILLWTFAAFLLALGGAGLAQTLPKRKRDAKGNQVKDEVVANP
ncbi:hypothetical protein ACIG87_23065 [Micromonospora sp. NPDC051925]|uniref:hypothetical protein n=1 Tax=Micromonospora sp. NPDC051925 TaxID=3364288 RepID=UPI0037C702AF